MRFNLSGSDVRYWLKIQLKAFNENGAKWLCTFHVRYATNIDYCTILIMYALSSRYFGIPI